MNSTYIYLVALSGILALIFAFILAKDISKQDAGNDRMKEIAGYIHEGAMAFLNREYRYLAIFIVIVAAIIVIFLNWQTAICFVVGAIFSMVAGYFGMIVATKANVKIGRAHV